MESSLILLLALVASIAGNVILPIYLTRLHQDEKRELHNRLMARDYPEFKMAADYDIELQRKKAMIEKESKEGKKKVKETPAETHMRKAADQF